MRFASARPGPLGRGSGFELVLDAADESVLVLVTMTVLGESVRVGVSVTTDVTTLVMTPVGAVSIKVTGSSDPEETCALASETTLAPARTTLRAENRCIVGRAPD